MIKCGTEKRQRRSRGRLTVGPRRRSYGSSLARFVIYEGKCRLQPEHGLSMGVRVAQARTDMWHHERRTYSLFPGPFSTVIRSSSSTAFSCLLHQNQNMRIKITHCHSTVKPWDVHVAVFYHVKFRNSSKVVGSRMSIPFCLVTPSCKLRYADNTTFPKW